jgi:uncharacterized OB-fold protein
MSAAMHELPDDWALPALTPFNERWFTTRSLAVQRCASCSMRQHPPEEICHRCGAMTFDHDVLSPIGTLHSYTIVHHAVHRALADHVPYAVALVALDDDPAIRVVGNLVDVERKDISIGMRLRAHWVERIADNSDVINLPMWRPA